MQSVPIVKAAERINTCNVNSQVGQLPVKGDNCVTMTTPAVNCTKSTDKHMEVRPGKDAELDISEASDDEFIVKKVRKKRKSGILSKPDEVDILKTVRYPHELLDDRHVKGPDKIFSKLNFALFCAGELELIRRPGILPEEKDARINVLLTLCYHHNYVSIDELKQQYAGTMQRIERGISKWEPSLAERLHHGFGLSGFSCSQGQGPGHQAGRP